MTDEHHPQGPARPVRWATVTGVEVTPVAFADPPLLNSVGVHQPWAIRSVIRVRTDAGVVGLGESYGDQAFLGRLREMGERLVGERIVDLHRLEEIARDVLAELSVSDTHGLTGTLSPVKSVARLVAAFEVALLDAQGHQLGVPVWALLGGQRRSRVEFSGYLFYKWAGHPGQPDDEWGPALDPAGVVAQARRMVDGYGFTSLKLKGGVFPPEQEAQAVLALAEAFPGMPLRIDPNAVWTVDTSVRVAERLRGVLEYFEDPTDGRVQMAEVARRVDVPLATNMCVVGVEDLPEAVRLGSVQVVLADHHYWGGLRASMELARTAEVFGLSLSMHSNSHLGISLAAMVHFGAAAPNIGYAFDTHWPWKRPEEDVVEPGVFTFRDGHLDVPTTPGLGVTLDEEALERQHRRYLEAGILDRDDTTYMQTVDPGYRALKPRW
ncbi:enolase C-terminal domain-like protein [Desertihabitans aurantiacus]|uniref:enolase C-terminal domain-like protein n=1 Tax=Desertihabitans aurantiacus TaxID=2282477 RepID=UPI000DF80F64|nr:enolase C-terminal domain-like protein [Desertihabitans aurantiacus]